MSDHSWAEALLQRFVLPLLAGSEVHVGTPLGSRGAERLLSAIAHGLDGTRSGERLQAERKTQLAALGAKLPPFRLSDDDEGALLLVALHDLLFLAHPDATRLKPERLAGVAHEARRLCEQAGPAESEEAPDTNMASALLPLYGRHSLLGPLWQLHLEEADAKAGGEKRPLGAKESATASRRPLLPELIDLCEGLGAQVLHGLLRGSPLTDLLQPIRADLSAALPLDLLSQARYLRLPAVARLLLRRYLELGLAAVGPVLVSEFIALLKQPAALCTPAARRDLGTWLCLFSHLHLLAHVVAELPLPAASSPPALLDFYALYAALLSRHPGLAMPEDVLADPLLRGQIELHQQRCRALCGPSRTRELSTLLGERYADSP
jgi:hypothetical protein